MAHSLHAQGLGLTSQHVWAIFRRSKISNRHNTSPHHSFSQVRMDVVGIETFTFARIAPFALKRLSPRVDQLRCVQESRQVRKVRASGNESARASRPWPVDLTDFQRQCQQWLGLVGTIHYSNRKAFDACVRVNLEPACLRVRPLLVSLRWLPAETR